LSNPTANRFWHYSEIDSSKGSIFSMNPRRLSPPQRQLSFLKIIHDLEQSGHAQFIISTHSPIILSYPGAVLLSLDGGSIQEIAYHETEHYQITRDFLNAPERFFRYLFDTVEDNSDDY
jgi:predicted ATPase